jgi:hypothetical protein
MALFRTRARIGHVLGQEYIKNLPLLYISHEHGARILTQKQQQQFFKLISSKVNPFQNPTLEAQIKFDGSNDGCLRQKIEELLDFDDNLRNVLTPKDCAHISGGFGCVDEAVVSALEMAKLADEKSPGGRGHMLQDIVVEGLAFAARSGDYFTARQILILYTLVSSRPCPVKDEDNQKKGPTHKLKICDTNECAALYNDFSLLDDKHESELVGAKKLPPPPLDTDRLRRAVSFIVNSQHFPPVAWIIALTFVSKFASRVLLDKRVWIIDRFWCCSDSGCYERRWCQAAY